MISIILHTGNTEESESCARSFSQPAAEAASVLSDWKLRSQLKMLQKHLAALCRFKSLESGNLPARPFAPGW